MHYRMQHQKQKFASYYIFFLFFFYLKHIIFSYHHLSLCISSRILDFVEWTKKTQNCMKNPEFAASEVLNPWWCASLFRVFHTLLQQQHNKQQMHLVAHFTSNYRLIRLKLCIQGLWLWLFFFCLFAFVFRCTNLCIHYFVNKNKIKVFLFCWDKQQ